jgi:phage/plasmid-associated DNA primase
MLQQSPLVPKDKADQKVMIQIKTEGPGILNWAIEGMKRLEAREW